MFLRVQVKVKKLLLISLICYVSLLSANSDQSQQLTKEDRVAFEQKKLQQDYENGTLAKKVLAGIVGQLLVEYIRKNTAHTPYFQKSFFKNPFFAHYFNSSFIADFFCHSLGHILLYENTKNIYALLKQGFKIDQTENRWKRWAKKSFAACCAVVDPIGFWLLGCYLACA